MELYGVELDELHDNSPLLNIPDMVQERTVHIDADFLAYQVSAFDDVLPVEMQTNCRAAVEHIRKMAGAQFVKLHLTPKGSDKGGRWDAALLKEYQGNRKDKPKPKYLHLIRDWMHSELHAIYHVHCEADDGMAIAQYDAIKAGTRHLSVIATKDKDLTMVDGIQLDWDTGELSDIDDPFGYINLVPTASGKKLKGRGWKFFWAQMLMGDPADNISGLPKICTDVYLPKGTPKAVGPVMAYNILYPVETNVDAFTIVRQLYKDYGAVIGFTNYRDGSPVPWFEAFQSEARLLWMRRKHDIDDAIHWMRESCH